MKRILSLAILLFSTVFAFAQEEKDYVIENDGSLSFSKVLTCNDGKTKEELFQIVEAYFSYNYNDGKSVIQTTNKEQFYIIGSGIYSEFAKETDYMFGRVMIYSAPHVIRIDCKDGRVRVIITVFQLNIRDSNWMDLDADVHNSTKAIVATYPYINAKKPNKLKAAEKREASVNEKLKGKIYSQFDAIEAAINQGNSVLENEDW